MNPVAEKFLEALNQYIRPVSFPVGIKMLENLDDIPPKAKRPMKDFKKHTLICQSISMARKYGWVICLTKDDIKCPLALTAFGFDKEVPKYSEGFLCEGMYTETKEAGAETESEVWKFPVNAYNGILLAPIQRVEWEVDLFVIYGNSAQVMRLVHAALYESGGSLKSSFEGRLDCSETVIQTMLTKECQVILPCYGDRVFGATDDTEMAFTVPWGKIETVVKGLEGTHRGGVRYPIPTFLRWEAEMPETYESLWEELKKEREK